MPVTAEIPEKGAMIGNQVFLGLVEREKHPPGHSLAGQLAPQKMWIKCRCGGVRQMYLKGLKDGVRRCKPCYQADRKIAKKERLARIKAMRDPIQTEYDQAVAFITSMILMMGRSKRRSVITSRTE